MVVYTGQCNFRCPFCHNRDLIVKEQVSGIDPDKILALLSEREGFIDGVVITGGEPTIHSDLPDMVKELKKLNLMVKLDTNGSNPSLLQRLLEKEYLDYVALDIKTSFRRYHIAVGVKIDTDDILMSINIIKKAGLPYEFRTTCVPGIVQESDIAEISRYTGEGGLFTLQQFQPVNTLDPSFTQVQPYSAEQLKKFLEIARQHARNCRLIGLGSAA